MCNAWRVFYVSSSIPTSTEKRLNPLPSSHAMLPDHGSTVRTSCKGKGGGGGGGGRGGGGCRIYPVGRCVSQRLTGIVGQLRRRNHCGPHYKLVADVSSVGMFDRAQK